LKPSPRPQTSSMCLSPILRNTAFRLNSTAANASRAEASKLDWNSFFKLRASRRRYTLASSIIASMASTIIGVQVLSEQDLESLGAQVMGLDPFIVLGLATAACGAVGWLAGPFLGNAVWRLVYRKYKPAFLMVSSWPHVLWDSCRFCSVLTDG
jgi:import inner membrane translocase subunit TIM23